MSLNDLYHWKQAWCRLWKTVSNLQGKYIRSYCKVADYEILYNIKMRRGRFIGDMYNAVGLLAKRKHSLRTVILSQDVLPNHNLTNRQFARRTWRRKDNLPKIEIFAFVPIYIGAGFLWFLYVGAFWKNCWLNKQSSSQLINSNCQR